MTNPRAEDEPHVDRVPDPEPAPTAAGEPPSASDAPPAVAEPTAGEPTVDESATDEPTVGVPVGDESAATTQPLAPAEPLPPTDEPATGAGAPPPPPRRDDPPLAGGAFPPPAYPGSGFPPPAGPGFPPPAGTGGWATRCGLVRPAQGRVFVGVCAALGRATNTDPVLWRVLLAVFTLAGGIGLIVYVLGWLFIPGEGDSGSPLEALLGRGQSKTNPVITIVVGVGALIGLASVFSRNVPSAIVPFGLIVLVIIMVSRQENSNRPGGYPHPPAPGYQPPVPPAAQYRPPAPRPSGCAQNPGGSGTYVPQPGGYRPPFAPHGPYAGPNPYQYPGLGPQPAPAPVPPPPPAPPHQRSRLGLITLSLALVAVGVLVIIALAAESIPAQTYIAVALAAVGLGLVVGAWVGRARWLIAPGVLLSLALAISIHVGQITPFERGSGDVTWRPTSVAELSGSYTHGAGTVTLDLTRIDFTDRQKTINVHLNAGDLRVILPSTVDAAVRAKVGTGDARVFDTRWSGIGNGQHRVTDDGPDGPGGGRLELDIIVNLGTLEVNR
jgi:phage shock protein PspC (stress-responsive transcriptional regulator)